MGEGRGEERRERGGREEGLGRGRGHIPLKSAKGSDCLSLVCSPHGLKKARTTTYRAVGGASSREREMCPSAAGASNHSSHLSPGLEPLGEVWLSFCPFISTRTRLSPLTCGTGLHSRVLRTLASLVHVHRSMSLACRSSYR